VSSYTAAFPKSRLIGKFTQRRNSGAEVAETPFCGNYDAKFGAPAGRSRQDYFRLADNPGVTLDMRGSLVSKWMRKRSRAGVTGGILVRSRGANGNPS
jgi:hypothetical protein